MASFHQLIICLTTLLTFALAVDQTVQLDYATYKGATQPDGVTQWLGMRYGKAPTGTLRYAAPQKPDKISGVQPATSYAKQCYGVQSNLTSEFSEDCLFLDVYAPTSAAAASKLPVFFYIQGGGFALNATPLMSGRGLLKASGNNIVVVTFGYRVGPYGFLAGKEVTSLNNGIKDQQLALQWVQENISKFGGNPNHVTLAGASAGGASVVIHLTADGAAVPSTFHAVAGESASFGPTLSVAQSQYQYDQFSRRLGCSSAKDSLACLRNKTIAETSPQTGPVAFPGAPGLPVFMWGPVIDGSLIKETSYQAIRNGRFAKVPAIFGTDTNEGTLFVENCTMRTQADSNNFLRSNFYNISQSQINTLNQLYPNKPRNFSQCTPWWRQAADVYGELRYSCPSLFLSNAFAAAGVPSYNYRYNVEDPEQSANGLGVTHCVETSAVFGLEYDGIFPAPASYFPGQKNAEIVPIVQRFWTSFTRSYDPNTSRYQGLNAQWEKYQAARMNRLLFSNPPNRTAMETVDPEQWKRCQYLWSIGESLQQ